MLSFLKKLHGILSRNHYPSVRLTDTYPVAITPPCGKNVQQRPLVIGANAIGVFSSRAQILRSLEEKGTCQQTWGQTPKVMLQALSNTCSEATERGFSSLPVIRYRSEVQAFGGEAHRSQGADVDIAVIHGGVELGVAEEDTGQ